MSKLLKFTSFSFLTGTLTASYYLYFVREDGYYYNNSIFKQVNDKVNDVIDNEGSVSTVFKQKIDMLKDKSTRDITTRSSGEAFKDLWNQQIRNSVEWIYSWGK